MPALSPNELKQKLASDYAILSRLVCPTLPMIRAYASVSEARTGREVTAAEGAAGLATVFDATYHFPIPVSRSKTTTDVVVRYQLFAGGNYPFTRPRAETVSRPVPWIPHVNAAGWVCTTNAWEQSRGEYLLAELVIHVAKLLNLDEKQTTESYSAYNGDAVRWWEERGRNPITKGLAYPLLPLHITHGVHRGTFRPLVARENAAATPRVFRAVNEPIRGAPRRFRTIAE